MQLDFAIPGDLATLTGSYGYDRRLIAGLRARGHDIRVLALPECLPVPDGTALAEAGRTLRAARAPLLVESLALCALPPELAASLPRPLIALVHHPLGLEGGLSPSLIEHLLANERAVLRFCDHVLVSSRFTAGALATDFGVPPLRITVAEPGTDKVARAIGSGRSAADGPKLVAAGSVVARKGHDVLVAALARLQHLPWQLDIIGSLTRDPACAARLQAMIDANGLGSRVTLRGELAPGALASEVARADIFVMPSLYEGFGMVLTEAMAAGLALVSSDGGALIATLPEGAGLKVSAGEIAALTGALARVIADPLFRQTLADAAWQAGQKLQRWDDTALRVEVMLQGVIAQAGLSGDCAAAAGRA